MTFSWKKVPFITGNRFSIKCALDCTLDSVLISDFFLYYLKGSDLKPRFKVFQVMPLLFFTITPLPIVFLGTWLLGYCSYFEGHYHYLLPLGRRTKHLASFEIKAILFQNDWNRQCMGGLSSSFPFLFWIVPNIFLCHLRGISTSHIKCIGFLFYPLPRPNGLLYCGGGGGGGFLGR